MDKKRKNLVKNSVIINFLLFLAEWIYRQIGGSFAAFIFTGYEKCEGAYKKSFFYSLFQGYEPGIIKNIVRAVKKAFIIVCENSMILKIVNKCVDYILAFKLRTVGTLLISFGFYSVVMYLLKIFVFAKTETLVLDLIAAVSLSVFGGLMAFSKQSLYHAVCGSKICNAVLFRFLGFTERRDKNFTELLEKNIYSKSKNIVCFFIGMVLGVLTYFASPLYIFAGILGIFALYAVLCYPEAGLLAILFALPFLPTIPLAGVCILVSAGYFFKLARGKRTFNFEIFDLFALMFFMLIFFGGFVSVSKTGSVRPALIYLSFTLIYFTGVNMIRSKEMIMRCVAMLAFSCFFVAAYGVYQNYFGVGETKWQDAAMFAGISGRIYSTLENPNVLATYLISVMPFLIVSVVLLKQLKARTPYIISLVFTGLCLVFTWSRGSWLAFIIASLILFIILDKRVIALYAAGILAVPLAPAVLPETIIARFMSIGDITDSSTSYRVSIWQGTLRMLENHFFGGIGIGTESFKLVYPEYSLAGIESAPHSHSLYLQLCVEYGIIGLAVFLLMLFLFMQCCFTAIRKSSEKYLRLFAAAGLCSVISFMLNGFTDLVWYNYRVFLMFWLVITVTVGICRFSLKNQITDKIY